MDKAYLDFIALYCIQQVGAFFDTRAKTQIKYSVKEHNFNIEESTWLRTDKTVVLSGYQSNKLYPEKLQLVEFYDWGKR